MLTSLIKKLQFSFGTFRRTIYSHKIVLESVQTMSAAYRVAPKSKPLHGFSKSCANKPIKLVVVGLERYTST